MLKRMCGVVNPECRLPGLQRGRSFVFNGVLSVDCRSELISSLLSSASENEQQLYRTQSGVWVCGSDQVGFQLIGGRREDLLGKLLVVHRAGHGNGTDQR